MLLTDVREAVRSIRGGATVDMVRVLAPLLADIARPRVHLDVPQGLSVSDPERAQALVRCVQEIITNAVRHARAENLWIEISEDEAGIRVEGRDDGQGAPSIRPGHGLTGMRERLTRLGGSVEYDSPTDGGFTVRALIPLVEPAR
jgi:signal transduction histidine kinase